MIKETSGSTVAAPAPIKICIFALLSVLGAACAISFGLVLIFSTLISLAAAFFAVLAITRVNKGYFAVVPVSFALGCVIIKLLGGGAELDILMLSFIVAGGALALCVVKRSSRTSTIVVLSICFVVVLLAAFLYVYLSGGNKFAPSAIKEYILARLDGIAASFRDIAKTYILDPMKGTPYYDSLINSGEISEADILDLISGSVYSAALLSIGVVIAFVQVLGYVCTCWLRLFVKKQRCDVVLPSPRWEIMPTKITAFIYLIAYFANTVSFFFASSSSFMSILQIVALNIVIALTPVTAYLGISFIFGKNRRRRARIGVGMIVIFVLLLLFSPPLAVSLVSMIGTFGLINLYRAAEAEKNDRDDNSDF